MKKWIALMLCAILPYSSVMAEKNRESIDQLAADTDALYRTGAGARDGAFTSLSTSMLGWGIGLALGIGILAAALHQSKASTHNAHCH